jgi:hypothetical protein
MTSRSMLWIHRDIFQLFRKDKLLFTRIKVIVAPFIAIVFSVNGGTHCIYQNTLK